jgi:hypothetical protein
MVERLRNTSLRHFRTFACGGVVVATYTTFMA